jgi:hypothetical protein
MPSAQCPMPAYEDLSLHMHYIPLSGYRVTTACPLICIHTTAAVNLYTNLLIRLVFAKKRFYFRPPECKDAF